MHYYIMYGRRIVRWNCNNERYYYKLVSKYSTMEKIIVQNENAYCFPFCTYTLISNSYSKLQE